MSLESLYKAKVSALKKKKAAEAQKPASPLSRVQHDTNLSRQYDNDGNPYPTEPKGYTADGGH